MYIVWILDMFVHNEGCSLNRILVAAPPLQFCSDHSWHLPEINLRNENISQWPPPYTLFSSKLLTES